MQKIFLRFFIFFAATFSCSNAFAQAQSSCANADFEFNNLNNWLGATGFCCPISMSANGMVTGRHTIMTGAGTDPYSLGQIPVVAPGGLYSCRLGNDNIGSEAEQLTYSFTVSLNTALFIYRYAVVLEDPGHDPPDQPRFEIRVYDQSGAAVTCGSYNVVSSASIPGFQNNGTYRFKTWTTIGIDLSSYIGQNISIEFSTGDCALGGHFGYAYVDCYCSPLQISADFCPGQNTSTASAPIGFASYLWSNGATTQSITITNPIVGTIYTCTMTSVTGCTVTLNTILTPTNIAAGFTESTTCVNDVHYIDTSKVYTGSALAAWSWNFGDGGTSTLQSPYHLYNTSGVYNVQLIVTNQGGCIDTVLRNVVTLPIPDANYSYSTACAGDTIQFNDLSTFAMGTITDWDWSFGDGKIDTVNHSPQHVFATDGTYAVSLIIEGSNGCTDTLVQQVATLPKPVANFNMTTVCANSIVGFSDLTAISSGTIVSYDWDFGDGTAHDSIKNPNHFYSSQGIFTVHLTVVGSSGCTDTISKQVNLQDLPSASFTSGLACKGNVTQFNDASSITGGTITQWSWNFGDGSPVSTLQNPPHIFNSAVSYPVTLIATANNGCKDSVTINVIAKPSPVADFVYAASCPNSPTQLTDQSVFAGGISTYYWDFGDASPTSSLQNPPHTFTTPGNYSVTHVVTASNGCIDTAKRTVVTNPAPNANYTIPTGCAQSDIPFASTSTITPGYSISLSVWKWGDGTANDSAAVTTHTYSLMGSYLVWLVTTSNNGCVDSVRKEVSMSAKPVAAFAATTVCIYAATHFVSSSTVSPGAIQNYTWNFGDGHSATNTTDTAHQYAIAGLYNSSLIIESSDGCYDTALAQVTVKAQPSVSFSHTLICEGDSVLFTDLSSLANGSITNWHWSFGDTTTSVSILQNPSHTYSVSATYPVTLIALGSNGCYDTLSQNIFVRPLPVPNFTAQNECIFAPVLFNDSSYLSGNSIASWYWNFDDGIVDSVNQNPSHAYLQSGFFNVHLQIVASNGCNNDVTKQIEVYPQPVANFTSSVSCLNALTNFMDRSSCARDSVVSWLWNFGDGTPTSAIESPSHSFTNDTIFHITLVAFSNYGCTDTIVKIVDVHPLPVPNFSATNVCFYDTSKFTDLSLVTSGNIVNWIWNFNDGNILSSTQNPQHYYTTAGTYAVGLTTTTNFNCVDSMKKNVEVYDLPVADFVPDINYGCEPLAVIFTDHSTSTDGNLVSWKWNLGNDSTPTTQYTNTIYPVHGNYTVSLITTTSFGCKDTIIYPDLISVYPNPTAGFTFDPEHPTILNPVIYFTDKSQIADFWTYTFGDNSDASRSQNPVHEYLAPGTYTVEQIVMTHFGCFDTLWATLEVASAYTFYLPDAFSPNNDGRNDFFTGKGIGIQNFDMVIFNRWGNKVFETDNISSGWNGGNSQEGTYVYVISVKDIFNDVHHLHGTVKLVR